MDPTHEHIPPTLFSGSPFIPATVNGIMTELSFAKSYLSLLDSRPIKLQADHVSPPQSLELNAPYTLPRNPGSTPMRKPGTTTSATGVDSSHDATTTSTQSSTTEITVHLKSTRNPTLSLPLPATQPSTSILDLKERIATELNKTTAASTDKIRILYQKKPCADSKTVKDVVGGDEALVKLKQQDKDQEGGDGGEAGGVEFGVMIMGYTASNTGPQFTGADAKIANEGAEMAEETGKRKRDQATRVMGGDEFWNDLQGWLVERLGDDGLAGEVVEAWRGTWKGRVEEGKVTLSQHGDA